MAVFIDLQVVGCIADSSRLSTTDDSNSQAVEADTPPLPTSEHSLAQMPETDTRLLQAPHRSILKRENRVKINCVSCIKIFKIGRCYHDHVCIARRFVFICIPAHSLYNCWVEVWNTALPHQAGASTLKVYYLDAGQGDSTLIKTPKGQHILIDAETILKDRMPSKILKAWASSSWMPRLRHIRTLTI